MCTMGRFLALLAVLLATPAPAQTSPSLQNLSFLVGSWESLGIPSGASGGSEFHYDLQGKVLVRTNHASYPASNGHPASNHEDLLILFLQDVPPIRGIYFDNEGHVIRYAATAAEPGHLVLASEPSPGQPRYRLSYSKSGSDRLMGEFSSATAEEPEQFTPMFKWELRRISPPAASPSKTP